MVDGRADWFVEYSLLPHEGHSEVSPRLSMLHTLHVSFCNMYLLNVKPPVKMESQTPRSSQAASLPSGNFV